MELIQLYMLFWIVVFVVSLYVLIKSADYFTDAAEKICFLIGLSRFVVGVTIVSIGTSLPELVTAVFAMLDSATEIIPANVVGSNIDNVLMVFGLAVVIGGKMNFNFKVSMVDLGFFLGSSLLWVVTVWDGIFTLLDAVLCLIVMVTYLIYIAIQSKKDSNTDENNIPTRFDWKIIGMLLASTIGLYLGGKFTVESIIELAKALGIETEIIAITAVALGTSLPELAAAIFAIKKNMPEMVIGNVLGSTVFNALAVMGIPALMGDLVVSPIILTFGLPVMLISVLLFTFIVVRGKKVPRWQGAMMFAGYVAFMLRVVVLEVL